MSSPRPVWLNITFVGEIQFNLMLPRFIQFKSVNYTEYLIYKTRVS